VTTLAARDALASGRVLLVGATIPAPESAAGAAIEQLRERLPWARITIVGRAGDPRPWWRRGVEVLVRDDPAAVASERAGHYDLVTDPAGLHIVEAIESPRRAAPSLSSWSTRG
jgi:hypothetical protein